MIQLKKIDLMEALFKFKTFWNALESKEIESIAKSDVEEYNILEMVNSAKEDWLDAKKYFEEVTEPDLIDHAIYRIKASEKKYNYLMKLSKQEKLVNNHIVIS